MVQFALPLTGVEPKVITPRRRRWWWRAIRVAPMDVAPSASGSRRQRRKCILASTPLTSEELVAKAQDGGLDVAMPASADECQRLGLGEAIQCPFVRCRHHLSTEVSAVGSLRVLFPHWEDDVPDDAPTCSLAEARKGAKTISQVGELMAIEDSRVGQIERDGIQKLAKKLELTVAEVVVALKLLGS
jgi:hypothetical protein